MKLVIDRRVWLRGEGGEGSYLLRESDGKRCCLGIYLKSLGVSDELLANQEYPVCIPSEFIPVEALWLVTDDGQNSALVDDLTYLNDGIISERHAFGCSTKTEEDRERRIAEHFLRMGVEVEFV